MLRPVLQTMISVRSACDQGFIMIFLGREGRYARYVL